MGTMAQDETSGWGTGGGRGEGAKPFGWDGFGWSDGTDSVPGSGSTKDRARAVWARSIHVGRSAVNSPSLGQRLAGAFMLALVIGLAILILVPAVVIGILVLAVCVISAFVRSAFRSMAEGANARNARNERKNVRVVGKSGE